MDPRKTNARRGWAQREAIRQENASQWQHETEVFTPKEGKKMNPNRKTPLWQWIIIIVVFMIIGCFVLAALAIWNPFGIQIGHEAPVIPTAAPTKVSVVTKPTEIPVVPTEIPVIEPTLIPVPVAVSCDTPSIKAFLDGQTWTEQGEYLDTVLGKRMTFTNRKIVVPSKAWNDPLTADELKLVEQTWVNIQICVVEGQNATLFAGGFEQKLNHYENGVLMTLNPGFYEFRMRNGEVVLWYPNQETFSSNDLDRIVIQIRNGNFDIHAELAFFATTADLLPKIPADLVKKDNVQVIPAPDPTVQ